MIETPFGKIKITVNNKECKYEEIKTQKMKKTYQWQMNPILIKYNHLDGCYRVSIPCNKDDIIACELIPKINVEKYNDGGENYACKIFQKDKIQLTLGSFDVVNNCTCDFIDNGLIFNKLQGNETKEIVFGVAWVTDLEEDDNRTWFAADPSLD